MTFSSARSPSFLGFLGASVSAGSGLAAHRRIANGKGHSELHRERMVRLTHGLRFKTEVSLASFLSEGSS